MVVFKLLDFLWGKVAPILSFSFLFPIFFLTTIVHEVGHGIIALALGGEVIAIELYQDAAFIHTNFGTQPNAVSYGIFVLGGILAQYALGLLTLVAVRKLRPRKFLLRSLTLWVMMQNLIAPSMSLGSLQGDSYNFAATLVNASGIEVVPILMQVSALPLVLATLYICEKETEAFLRIGFHWLKRTKIRVIATLIVISYTAISIIYFFAKFSYPLYFLAIALGITTLSLTIPSQLSLKGIAIQKNRNFSLKDLVFSSLFFGFINAFFLFATPFLISPYI